MAAGGGFSVAIGDISGLRKTWQTQQGHITSMAGQLADMPDEIVAAANQAMAGKSKKEQQAIKALARSAVHAVSAAQAAVKSLSGQLSTDATNLSQTADTYRLAELLAKDHISSLAQLASYHGPDAGKIHSLLEGEGQQARSQTERQALGLAFPGQGSLSSTTTGGSSGGGGGGGTGGGGTGGSGGSTGSGGGAAGGGGTGHPVAPSANTSAQVKKWINQAIKILEQHGVPASKLDPNAIALIIQHESGGNPNAVNHWDSNAAAGHPSEGLMQTIGPTFNSYKLPGHDNILNPVDNIIAGTRYAISRYGSLDNVPGVAAVARGGSYVGY
ncbi:MAG: transglycosylase SLT domain-containing protein [Nocardiopsaceae bacterium]|nr:transglycosylase SLT domain-containing protein [Nocardiopsaceae bacterium]